MRMTQALTRQSLFQESGSEKGRRRAGAGSDLRRRGAMRILMLNYEYPPLGGGGSNASNAY